MTQSGVTTIHGNSLASGNESATSSGATESGGPTKNGGVGASTNTWGPLPIFNLIVDFLCEMQ